MALQFSSGNEIVDRIGQIDFTMCGAANMLLPSWFKTICYDNGKCNLNACVILSEIVGWYKPTPVKDERTGQILGWKAKFKADLLQKNYQDLGETFGLTKRQASEAVVFLEHMGLIRRELRSVTTESGLTLGNVLFIELIVDRLLEALKRQKIKLSVDDESILFVYDKDALGKAENLVFRLRSEGKRAGMIPKSDTATKEEYLDYSREWQFARVIMLSGDKTSLLINEDATTTPIITKDL